MASALTDRRSVTAERGPLGGPAPALTSAATPETLAPAAADVATELAEAPLATDLPEAPVATDLLADLHHPDLVLSEGYVGPERRAKGRLARLRRATFSQRRSVLTLEFAVVVAVIVVVTAVVVTGPAARPGSARPLDTGRAGAARASSPTPPPDRAPTTTPSAPAPSPSTTAPAPSTPPAAIPAPATPPAPAAAPAPPAAPLTPTQLGAEALTLVRYPWQQIPGYSIQFLPISDAPSPGFYGNTTFTWGHTGGTSVLYVYPGETVTQLAGVIAFEIAHEVDAAAVEPAGGDAQIENILNYHPASWAPDCDCAEQGFLSGWYAAAFSNYWSPGVGNWSELPVAPPSGASLAAVAAWLNPAIP